MHIPKLFEITDNSIIEKFINENGLATLITKGSPFPVGTHIPIDLEINENGNKVLWGHISKANPQWKDFENDENVLVIFLSPVHSYISSSWYNHPNAPTWNYLSVHITGKLKIIEGEKLWETVRRLTNRYEQKSEHPVSLDTLPESVQKQMNGIVGFEIRIDKVEAAFKLSQNRNDEDFENIVKQLRLSNELSSRLMADVMERERLQDVS
ncbi:MAG: FMN-binding negative transcriptional regulator [Chitinophagaceae bacterium]|nr:FMN-binding negative transcriptional regulator [Chitinophagaceae bacterium]